MEDITPEPQSEQPTVAPTADTAAGQTPVADTATQPIAEPTTAATPEPFAVDEPRKRRFSTPVAGGVLAGVIGLGLGAGVVALASGHDDRHGNDRRMSDQQVQIQQPGQQGGMMPGAQGQQGRQGTPGQQGQQGQQGPGGFMPGRRGDRQGHQGQQSQQGGFFPPNGGGQPQGRSGGS